MAVARRRQWLIRGILICSFCSIFILIKQHFNHDFSKPCIEKSWNAAYYILKMRLDDEKTIQKSSCPLEPSVLIGRCALLKYDSMGSLPKASIIVTFHDSESLSALLHTIHSVIQRSPINLIEEIIVIDDFSKKEEFGRILENYIKSVFSDRVKLHRNSENLGVIRSRLKGARLSRGEVLVFMDSHSEVQSEWLEPLLFEIKKNRKSLVNSVIDWMEETEDNDWMYSYSCTHTTTVFDWSMGFGWNNKPQAEIKTNITDIYRSRIIIGAYSAIEKKFFQEIGEFDEGMEFWGGENIDLSLRVWLFGGEVTTVPCSRVAHLEGENSRAYREPYQLIVEKNYKRVAEVWFDEYKDCFYYFFPHLVGIEVENLTDRFKLKNSASHDMKWYLENVYPELGCPVRDALAFGPIHNKKTKSCLAEGPGFTLHVFNCSDIDRSQITIYWSVEQHLREPNYFYHVLDGEVEKDEFLPRAKLIRFLHARWIHWKDGPLIESSSKLCLEAPSVGSDGKAKLEQCNYDVNSAQIWNFRKYTEQYEAGVNSNAIAINLNAADFQNRIRFKF